MKKDRKKMWQVVCLFVLSMILSGAFGAMGAEADAKAYEFIIPDVDIEYLSSADIQDMPLQVVCYAKNEISARHGRMFQSQELTNYFEEQLWYYGCISPSEFSSSVLNVYETANIKLLSDRESALRSGGYVLDQPGYDFSAVYQYIYGNISYEVQNDYYVFPDSDARYLSNADASGGKRDGAYRGDSGACLCAGGFRRDEKGLPELSHQCDPLFSERGEADGLLSGKRLFARK